MILYVIRHGHAEDRLTWVGNDLDRPLVEKGIRRAYAAFSKYFKIYEKPQLIISSAALRSVETAEILREITDSELKIEESINPGALTEDYVELIDKYASFSPLAFVGHEPDMSEFISDYAAGSGLYCIFKKGSIAHIENGMLKNFVQQKVLL